MKKIVLMVAAMMMAAMAAQAKDYELKSPDGKIVVTVSSGAHVSYSIVREGIRLLSPSQISMMLLDGSSMGGNDSFKVSRRSVDTVIPARNYKRTSVRDHFNEMTLSAGNYDIVFRAYDDGVAYRFVSRGKAGEFAVAYEQAEFSFPYDYQAYVPYVSGDKGTIEQQFFNSFENTYAKHLVSQWRRERSLSCP